MSCARVRLRWTDKHQAVVGWLESYEHVYFYDAPGPELLVIACWSGAEEGLAYIMTSLTTELQPTENTRRSGVLSIHAGHITRLIDYDGSDLFCI